MLRRMLIVALLLGSTSAFADGIAVTPATGVAVTGANPMVRADMNVQVAARLSGTHLFKALLFSKTTKVPRPSEEGDVMF